MAPAPDLERLLASVAAIPRIPPGSLRIAPHVAPQASQTTSLGLGAEQAADVRAADYSMGVFGPDSGLTPAQAAEANRLLARANHLRPIRGRNARERYARRIGGIKSAVLGGRVLNSHFGRSLHGHRGGRVMKLHGLHLLRAIAPRGAQAAKAARERKKAQAHFDHTGEVLPLETETGQFSQPSAAWQEQRPFMMW